MCLNATTYADRESVMVDRFGRPSLLGLGENADYRVITCTPRQEALSAALFAFPKSEIAFLYGGQGQFFGRFNKVYKLPIEAAVAAAKIDTGIEFEFFDVRMSPP